MTRPIKSITDPKLSLGILTPEEVQRLHQATLDVIESVGVRFPSKHALEIWAAHGAAVDWETSIVKAPDALIEAALKRAPPKYTLAARDPAQDLPLDGNHVHLGTDGCGVEVIDQAAASRGKLAHAPARDGKCLTCHDPHAGKSADALKLPERELCATCHQLGGAAFDAKHRGYKVGEGSCSGCHDPHGSGKPGLANAFQHAPYTEGSCESCHAGPDAMHGAGAALCTTCHSEQEQAATQHSRMPRSHRSAPA